MKSRPSANPEPAPMMTVVYRDAAARVRKYTKFGWPKAGVPKQEPDPERLVHELNVHQIELEMQNAELLEARNRMEELLEKYTDLYDFAPVGYLSLDDQGQILEVNLSGAELLGMGRARLLNRRLPALVTPADRGIFLAFLKRAFAGGGKQVCEVTLLRQNGPSFPADIHGAVAISARGARKWCRVVISDITGIKRAQEAQRRAQATETANAELRHDVARREGIEESLRTRERHQRQMLDQSRRMEDQSRNLSRLVLQAQEEERKRISRELHDGVVQTLVAINIRLITLTKQAGRNAVGFGRSLARTQRMMEDSVKLVYQFARELRPPALDDLGLIPALHAFMKQFQAETGIRVSLSAAAAVAHFNVDERTMLYRVAQEAFANIARHAQASRADVKIQKRDGTFCMTITDDGKGFEQQRLQDKKRQRLGLLGMRERLEIVNGSLTLRSAPGKGTTVRVQIPFADGRARGRKNSQTKSAGTKLKNL